MLHLSGPRRKYGNEPVDYAGIHFDSKAEYRRYRELCLLVAAGEITCLTVHPRYLVFDGFRGDDGRLRRPVYYEGDFEYVENGRTIVEDVKGGRATRIFELKRKLFEARYPEIELRVIRP